MINTIYRLRTAMKYKSLSLLAAACSMTLLTGCAASQNGQIRLGDMVNEVVRVVTTPSTQAAGNTQQSKSEITDWTFYLAPMQEGCNYPHMSKDNPQVLRKSVENVYRKGNPELEGDEVTYYFNLKNAIAFGYPITRIEYLQGYEWSHLKVVFADSRFTNLRPSFKLPKIDEDATVLKNNAAGYDIESYGYTALEFNTADNSITCSSGV